jgi:large subunit ribosomal protein L24
MLIDELRGKYSRFRTRHTEEYIAKKEAEQAAKTAKVASTDSMLTPVQEFNRLRRQERRARGQPVLTDDMLAKIGEVMARNGQQTVQFIGNGVSEVERAVDAISLESKSEESRPPPS